MPSNRRGTVRRSTVVVVDIGLDVGVNVGQGTSTCGRPIREQKNTRYKWEVRSREPFSPTPLPFPQLRMPLLPLLFHNAISPRFSRLRPPRNLGRDSLRRDLILDSTWITKLIPSFWEAEGSIIPTVVEGCNLVRRFHRRRACFSKRYYRAFESTPKSVNYRVRLEWRGVSSSVYGDTEDLVSR